MAIVDPFAAKPKNPGIVDPFTAPQIPRAISDLSGAPVAAPPAAGYNFTDIPKELVAGALHGTGSAVSGIGDVGRMIARPIVAGVNAANGADVLPEPTNAFEPIGSAISKVGERVAGSESAAAQEAKAKPIITGDITRPDTLSLGEGAKSPMALALGAANLAGEVVPMLAGGLEGRALKLAPEIVEALPGIAAKLSRGEALTAGETAAAEAGAAATKSAGRRALGTGAAIGGTQGAEGSAEGERARIEAMSESDISKLPGYQSKLQSGMNPADARAAVASEAANTTFMATLPVATIAGAVGTAPLLHETQSVLSKIAGEGVARRAAVGAALEAPVQGAAAVAQNAASIAGANEATGETRDVTENSAPIALTGAALGAGFGAFGGAVTRPKAAVPYPDAPAGSLSDAANAVHEHGAKPLTPEAAVESGAEILKPAARTAEAQTAQPTAETAPPETGTPEPASRSRPGAPAEAAAADLAASQSNQVPSDEATAAAEAPPPPDMPWVDKNTGEYTKPTDEQLRDQFHKMFAAADAGGSTMRATAASRMLADEWGVPRERLIEQRRYALDERNKGFKAGDTRPEQTKIATESASEVPAAEVGATAERQAGSDVVPGTAGEKAVGDIVDAAPAVDEAAGRKADTEAAVPARELPAAAGRAEEGTQGGAEGSLAKGAEEAAKPVDTTARAEESVTPFYDMTADELQQHSESVKANTDAMEQRILGAQVGEWRSAHRAANSSYDARAKSGQEKIDAIEEKLPAKDRDALYGIGERARDFDTVDDFRREIDAANVDSPQEAADRAAHWLTKLGTTKGRDPATWDRGQQVAYAGMRAIRDRIHDQGWDNADIQKQALRSAARKFGDANDAEFMLQRFLQPREKEPTAPAPALESRVEPAALEAAAHPENDLTEPTAAQQAANNAKAGHVNLHGLDVTIQVPKGGMRRGTTAKGKPWERAASDHYGHIKRTEAADGEQHDVYLGPHAEDPNAKVFVIDQVKPGTRTFDETKSMIGYATGQDARRSYDANFPKGLKTFGGIREMSVEQFKAWVKSDAAKRPVSEVPLPPAEKGVRESKATLAARAKQIVDGNETPPIEPGVGDADLVRAERLKDAAAGHYAGLRKEIGWDSVGGKMIREVRSDGLKPEVTGRTPWVGKPGLFGEESKFWRMRPDKISEKEAQAAFDKADQGHKMTPKQQRFIDWARKTADDYAAAEVEAHELTNVHDDIAKSDALQALRDEHGIKIDTADEAEALTLAELTQRAQEAGLPDIDVATFAGESGEGYAGRLWSAIKDRSESHAAVEPAKEGDRAGRSEGGEERQAAPGETEKGAGQEVARPRGDLFAGATPREQVAAAVRTKEAELAGGGRKVTNMREGDGELFAGPRPEQVNLADTNPARAITDIGEKIGGARKDTARSTGAEPRAKSTDERPTWAKRFDVGQIVKSMKAGEEGRWSITDKKNLDRLGQPRTVGDSFASKEEADAALPLLALAQKHRVRMASDGTFGIVRDVTDRKRIALKEGFASREDAMRYMAGHALELLEQKTSLGEEALPKPETVSRVGPPKRTGDVEPKKFADDFGFRGVEFGNWNNQADRQEVMNHAYDGLHDLAELLDIPAKAISLNGELGLAFGARGHGLSSARAHYETDYAVMNLTKMQGAGALAHEWMHALDHYLGRQDTKASSVRVKNERGDTVIKTKGAADFLSHGASYGDRSKLRAELRDAYADVIKTMTSKGEKYVRDTEQAEKFTRTTREDLAQQLGRIRENMARERQYGAKKKAATAEQLADWDVIANGLISGEDLATTWQHNPKSRSFNGRWTNEKLDQLAAINKAVTGRTGFQAEAAGELDRVRALMSNYADRLKALAEARGGAELEKRVPTEFRMNAIRADQGRGTDYWSTPHEMTARAFSSFVEDRLAEQGRSSDFLSYGSNPNFVLPLPEYPRPFPQGAERVAINAAFDKMFKTVQTRETDQGTALFRRGSDIDAVADPTARAHAQAVSDAVRDVVKDWGENAPRVRVVASAEDLPLIAQLQPRFESAKGFYDGNGNAYIVAKNHANVRDALDTVAHEAIGHHGIENILNDHVAGGWDKLSADIDRLRTDGLGSKAMRDVLANVEKRYPGADKTTFAQETLAVMAERGIRNGLIDRAIAAVRAYIRKIMPNLRMSEADLRALLQHSEDFITAGTPLEQRQAQLAAMSFSHAAEAGLTPAEAARPNTAADAARAYREQGTDSPYFKKFFGASKVVDRHGDPMTVYHGTGEDFSVFESAKAGTATEHSTSPLGHFFTENKKLAERYAENAADGRPADQRVIDAYVKIEKPYEMSLDEAHGIDDPAQARALRAKLEAQGFDGIHIAEAKSWVPFKSEQIKSVENRGTFDAKHGDINFSLPEASMDTLDEVIAKPDDGAFAKAKDWVRGKAEDFRPAALGALQTRHIIDLADHHPALKASKQYGEKMQALDSDRYKLISGSHDAAEHPNDMLKKGGATIAGDTQKFAREKGVGGWLGRENPETRSLAEVMNQATIHGLDPSMEYTRLMMEDKNGRFMPWTPQAVNEKIRSIRGQMRGRPGDDKRAMMDEVKMLRGLKGREANRVRTWPQLLAAWQKLSPEAKKVYQEHRDWYAQMRDETEKGIIARVEAIGRDMAGTAGAERAQRFMNQTIQRIRLQFELNRLEGVYFPLNRDGDFWMSISDAKGQQGFKMFESAAEAASAEKKLRAAGFKIDAQGRRDSAGSAKQSVPGTFIGDIIGLLKKNGAPEKVQDEVYQTFLRTLPEMSMRKHSIHRKKVPGFEDDPVRAFSKNSFHGAHQLARLRHSHEMQGLVDAMQLSMDNYRQGTGGGENKALDVARGDALLGEIKKRHEYIMSPKDTQLANVANSIGFIYNMALTPAAALTNLTQNAQVTLPVLGAHHGWAGASRQLGAAVRDSLRTGGNIDRTLTNPTERMAYNVLRERGDITKTQTHTLAGLAEGNKLTTNPVWARAMTGMSYLFHKAEVVNREAAGIAAFRLQYAKTKDFQNSVQYASDIVNGTHFDYSAANRPRYMQGNTARVALQFKNYSVGMTWMLYRNLYQAFKGESPEVRSVARKTLTGILGMTGLMAGTMGLPIINAMRFAGNAAHSLFGSDEEPNWDFDTEFRSWLADNLGEDAAKYVADGAVNRLGANLATRTSLSNLWFRDADKELEGKDAYYAMLEGIVGPLGGLAKNLFVGAKMAGDGQVYRGIETMMPKFAKDAMKATRFAHDGANTLRGDPILPDVTGPEAFIQGIGFQPTRLFETQRKNAALKNYEQGILDRRQTLMNAYAMAVSSGDDRDVAMAKIHAFNQQYPEIALKADSIRQSLRARARYTATADSGIFINKKIRERVNEEVGQPSL